MLILNLTNYHRNLQGDVIAICDANGEKQVEYAYDAWGNCEVICADTQWLAHINPIRYRGYYYDTETGLYYLNARYYSPEWRRFISPDAAEYIDSETPNGLNLYLFLKNNPVCNTHHNNLAQQIEIASVFYGDLPVSSRKSHSLKSIIPASLLSFSVGLVTPGKEGIPSWASIYLLYAKGSLGWGYSYGGEISLASFGIGVLDATFHLPKLFIFLSDDNLANPNWFFGIGAWNISASLGAGISGTAEIISGSTGIQFGDSVSIGVKGYIGVGFTFDLTNGLKIGCGLGFGWEFFINFDWYELFE